MIIYSKNKKLYGSVNNIPTTADEELLYMDENQNKLKLAENDLYWDNQKGGIIRKSDGKQVDVYIDDYKVIPATNLPKPVKPDFKKHSEYLYEISINEEDYTYAEHYYKWDDFDNVGLCSSLWKDGKLYRNFDWNYNNDVAFVVRVSAKEDEFYVNGKRYASLGVADSIPGLTKDFVKTKYYAGGYKLLPFRTVDGVNEKGVGVSMNVVPTQKGIHTITVPIEEKKYEIQGSQLTRFILDNFETAEEAVDYIKKHVAVYANKALTLQNYDLHYLITDVNNAYLVEIIDNTLVSKKVSDASSEIKPVITNFNLLQDLSAAPITLDNGKVYTPADVMDGKIPSTQGITSHAAGLERYNILIDNWDNLENFRDLVLYNKAYYEEENPWYSEFVGEYPLESGTLELTVDTPAEIFDQTVMPIVRDIYKNRDRNVGDTWHTTHTSYYDLSTKTLTVFDSSEDNKEYKFQLEITPDPKPTYIHEATIIEKKNMFKNTFTILNIDYDVLYNALHAPYYIDTKNTKHVTYIIDDEVNWSLSPGYAIWNEVVFAFVDGNWSLKHPWSLGNSTFNINLNDFGIDYSGTPDIRTCQAAPNVYNFSFSWKK